MAKAIKFSLMVNGHPARSMDDIRENFNISDLLVAVENGELFALPRIMRGDIWR